MNNKAVSPEALRPSYKNDRRRPICLRRHEKYTAVTEGFAALICIYTVLGDLFHVKDKDDPYYLWVEGSIYASGIDNIESDFSKAITYFTKSFEKGSRNSSVCLAQIYFTKDRKETFDIKKGIEWLKKGIESNSTDAMVLLSQIYLHSKDNEDFKSYQNPSKGIELLQKAINHGSGDAYAQLGIEFFNGTNVNKDDKKYFEYSQKAYELRNGLGANNLGACYQEGLGCERNINKAIEIYCQKSIRYFQIWRFSK